MYIIDDGIFPGLASFDKVLKVYHLAKYELGEILSSCEMMDRLSLDVSISNLGMKNPLTSENGHEFYMLIETSGNNLVHDEEKLSSFVEKAINDRIIEDGTLTNETTKLNVRHIDIFSNRNFLFGMIFM